MENLNKVFTGDCFALLKTVPDKSIDLILTDLPYGITKCSWDKELDLTELWREFKRVRKPDANIVLTATNPFSSKLVMSNLSEFKYEWIWDKHIPRGFQYAKYRPMQKHETVLVFGAGRTRYYPIMIPRDKPVTVKNYSKIKDSSHDFARYDTGQTYTYTHRNPDTVLTGFWEANAGKIHPTQKPVSLFEYLIKTYTLEGEVVLDPCAGSFTTAIAAMNCKRNWVCGEINPDYCSKGLARINSLPLPNSPKESKCLQE